MQATAQRRAPLVISMRDRHFARASALRKTSKAEEKAARLLLWAKYNRMLEQAEKGNKK